MWGCANKSKKAKRRSKKQQRRGGYKRRDLIKNLVSIFKLYVLFVCVCAYACHEIRQYLSMVYCSLLHHQRARTQNIVEPNFFSVRFFPFLLPNAIALSNALRSCGYGSSYCYYCLLPTMMMMEVVSVVAVVVVLLFCLCPQ